MAANPKPTKKPKVEPLFNIRISGQIAANSVEDAYRRLGAHCQLAAKKGNDEPSPLVEGGILRITPAEGA